MTAQCKRTNLRGLALSQSKGFTLIELLVVIGILAVLLAITLIAINPARQFSQANNAKRASDANAILNAIHQFSVDNNGILPTGITATVSAISDGGADICDDLVPEYIAALPSDPQTNNGENVLEADCGSYNTGYEVVEDGNSRVTVSAPDAELGETIEVTR
jgi:prepilin-type N-terminal cleavage/methylation domain-containing protein